jgi:S-DNA-T family DNA segregation ATPase FtsK/SpoIIIE
MIDPKMVELSMYAKLPHLRHPVVTNPNDAAAVLKWAVYEMERRYALLSANGARSIGEFNRRIEDGAQLERPGRRPDDDPDDFRYEDGPLPFIVVVVDELADLMMTVQADIEKPLAQLAQKARAIGIHLIVATQRPSVNVITGLIKANFPCRIAFRVASKVDSRTIIDQNGADALLGNGDMLFLPPTTSDPVRVQGAFLSTDDTERMVKWFSKAGLDEPAPTGEEDILEFVREREASDTDDAQLDVLEERDVLFRQAAELCIQHNQGSTSLLQRRLRIGYGRAARVIDQLHHAGVLGPPDGSKPREVLVGMESLDHVVGTE